MTHESERRSVDAAASPRQSWIVPILAILMFALFAWLFLGGRGEPPAGGRERPPKSKAEKPPRDGVRP